MIRSDPLHRDGRGPADALVEGAVEERIRSSIDTTTAATDPISTALGDTPPRRVGEEQHEHEDHDGG